MLLGGMGLHAPFKSTLEGGQRAGLPTRLCDVGVAGQKLPAIADIVLEQPSLMFNPRPIEFAGQLLQGLEAARLRFGLGHAYNA